MLSTALRCYVRRNRLCLISSVGYHSTNDYYQLLLMLNGDGDKSFVDDLVASRYCKCESSLCCYEALRFILCFYDLFFSVKADIQIEAVTSLIGCGRFFLCVFFWLLEVDREKVTCGLFFWRICLAWAYVTPWLFICTVAILAQGKPSG